MAPTQSLEQLQTSWKTLFQQTLPNLATSKSPAQPRWPVHVDHCFARIILDNVVGIDTPWMQKVKSPAWKNLTEDQLKKCIEMGEGICEGRENLVELDRVSLRLRGKKEKLVGGRRVDVDAKKKDNGKDAGKGKEEVKDPMEKTADLKKDGEVSKYFTKQNLGKRGRAEVDDHDAAKHEQKEPHETSHSAEEDAPPHKSRKSDRSSSTSPPRSSAVSKATSKTTYSSASKSHADMSIPLSRIAKSNKTPFQKQVLSLLCQVPPGQYTTYGLISTHLSSSARAVGNALRNNPFAPEVPCHRVLATGGALGGFGGSWGRNGKEGLNDDKKRKLLRDEGVKFDGKGKVVGGPWSAFD